MRRTIHWILSTIDSIDDLFHLPVSLFRYIKNYIIFSRQLSNSQPIYIRPTLFDHYKSSGQFGHEYFYQDLFVAQLVFQNNFPNFDAHLDVGSRIDGFVSHVASFMHVTYLDIRPSKLQNQNINTVKCDISCRDSVNSVLATHGKFLSVSCLHVIEHIGLGRYGDPIGTNLAHQALRNITNLLDNSGILYLSTPVGHPRVEFDCNYVFDPSSIIELAQDLGLELLQFYVLDKTNVFNQINLSEFKFISKFDYHLGLFIFRKS